MNYHQSKPKGMMYAFFLLSTILFFGGCKGQDRVSKKSDEGWVHLFNGTSTSGWRAYNQTEFPKNWSVENGELRADGTKGDLIYATPFTDFKVTFDWKVEQGGNSGFFFYVNEGEEYKEIWRTGIEMQLMDDGNNALGKNPMTSSGSVYQLYPAKGSYAKPYGEWNTSSIEMRNGKVRYWLNNNLVNEFTMWTDEWYRRREETIHNSTRKPVYGEFKSGYFALQDEGFPVAFRNIKYLQLQ